MIGTWKSYQPRRAGRLLRAGATTCVLATAFLWTACGDDNDDDGLDGLDGTATLSTGTTGTPATGGTTPGGSPTGAATTPGGSGSSLEDDIRTQLQSEPWFTRVQSIELDGDALVVVMDANGLAEQDLMDACDAVATRALVATTENVEEVRIEDSDGDTLASGNGAQCELA